LYCFVGDQHFGEKTLFSTALDQALLTLRAFLLQCSFASTTPIQPIRCGFDDYRASTPTSFRLNRSASFMLFLRPLMTNVLFSPKVDHSPRGTSLNSTNRQSVTSVSFSPRQSRTAGETSRPAPPFRLGFGRSLPKTYCQWSVRKGPASSHCAYAIRLPFRIATQRSLQVEGAGPWYASLNHGTTRGASGRWPVCALSLYGSAQ